MRTRADGLSPSRRGRKPSSRSSTTPRPIPSSAPSPARSTSSARTRTCERPPWGFAGWRSRVSHPEDHCHPEAPPAEPGPSPRPRPARTRRWFLGMAFALTGILLAASGAAVLTPPPLARAGVEPVLVKDYINDRSFRAELTALNGALGIPFELQSHLVTFVSGATLTAFEGHVPGALIEEALGMNASARPERILVFQDSMGAVVAYRAWAFAGMPQMYPIDTSLAVYVAWYEANVGGPDPGGPSPALLPLVLATGLLAGLHPCAS